MPADLFSSVLRVPVGRRTRAAEERLCEGCGRPFLGRRNRPTRFCSHRCGPPPPVRRGAANNRYNGGLCFSKGRWVIVCRDGSLMLYARGVMAAKLGRLLRSDEIVHHVNEHTDDDRPENLEIVTRAEHIEIHRDALLRARGIIRGC